MNEREPRCLWLEPGRNPQPCDAPAEWVYEDPRLNYLMEFRCKRHAPKDTSLWRALVAA